MRCEERLASFDRAETPAEEGFTDNASLWEAAFSAISFVAFRTAKAHRHQADPVQHLSEGDLRSVYYKEEDNGDLVITLGSGAEESEIVEHELYLRDFPQHHWRFRFSKRPDGNFVGRVVIKAGDREVLPKQARHWGVKTARPQHLPSW
jgi:hypothetical protein